MRLILITFAALLIANLSALASVTPNRGWKNALTPKGTPGSEVTLAERGRALYDIIVPKAATTQERKAADDLALYLGEISGAEFTVSEESRSTPAQGKFISVGKTRLLAKSGSDIARAKLGDEGYAIDEVDGNLFLTGGATRGPINAVYALLEEDLGCRWYSRFSRTIPHMPVLTLRPVKRTYVPALEIRDPYYWEAFDGNWSLANRTNSSAAAVPAEWGGNKAYALFVHTFGSLVPADKYFGEHPEYFREANGKRDAGQICMSNPEVLKITIESVKAAIKAKPGAQIISVSPNDGIPCCACAQCKALADAEGGMSGPLIKFVNAVAEEVGKEYPNVRISTLAYLDTFAPPKTVRPGKNVAIQICTDSHAWAQPFLTVEDTPVFKAGMAAWDSMDAAMHVWDYTCNFSHYAAPTPNWQVVTDDIRWFVAHNATGVMLQGNYQTPGTADGFLRCWVWAKLLWDPTLDTRALIKDFCYGYYGNAAGPMWDYQRLLWDTWETQHLTSLKSPSGGIRYPMTIFDSGFMILARDCFARARILADDAETRARVEESELQILYAEIVRASANGKPANMDSYKANLDKFERIARRIKVTHIQEGAPDFEQWISAKKALVQ